MQQTSQVTVKAWRDGVLVAGHDDPGSADGSITDLVHDPSLLVWIDLVAPTQAALVQLGAEVGLGETSVEDALAPFERPKVTRHDSHVFVVTYATPLARGSRAMESGRLSTARVSAFILPTALITVRLDDTFDMAAVETVWAENASLLHLGTGALVHGLLDVIVDGHFEAIQLLDDDLEAMEDVLFEERTTDQQFMRQIYGVRKDLVALRRVVLPMREVVNALLRHGKNGGAAELEAWYDDLYDHVLRAAEWTESLRDMVTTVFETNLSLQDARLNLVMRKLSGWAAIIAVPTAVTGWFGQNIPYPGFDSRFGLLQSVTLIAVMSLGLYVGFKRRDWL